MSLSAFNHVNLALPPCVVYSVPLFSGWRKAVNLLTEMRDALNSDQLGIEIVLFNRLLSRMRHVFKQHKHYKSMQRQSKCLKKIQSMEMGKVYSEFAMSFPNEGSGNFPSRQTLEYILVKTISLVELLVLSCDHCFRAIEYLWPLLHTGVYVHSNIVNTACLSRLWVQCSLLAISASTLYRELSRLSDYLKPSPIAWLPPDVTLPSDLDQIFASSSVTRVRGIAEQKTDSGLDKALKHLIASQSKPELTDFELQTEQINHDSGRLVIDHESIGTLVSRHEFNLSSSSQPKATELKSDSQNIQANPPISPFAELKNELRKLRTGKQIFKWLKEKSHADDAERVMTTAQWNGLKRCIKDSVKDPKEDNTFLTNIKKFVIKWLKQPRKCLQAYKKS